MKRLALLPALLLAGLAWAADDKPKLNTLTAKEISDGWLLLFDGETTFGWKIDGEAKVEDGLLILGGKKATTATPTTAFGQYVVNVEFAAWQGEKTTIKFADFEQDKTWWTLGRKEWCHVKDMFGKRDQATVPLAITVPANSQVAVRNVKVRPRDWEFYGLKSPFNGKDLTGWKEHPGKKSKFTVEDGAIHIKDGPGDLQTEGQWADFVLQLECISNGKHLNSGVFFRCRPGEYQQGYEAQVHNGFGEQPKEYTIEDYDPKTHQLTGTHKEKFLALDYGTGAIYRRMPARKQMAKDGEWFGMTVVAQGRHMAVWVNGVQVTDWTDNRPVADNARKGAMLEKGNISLQGHDPTTDLSFRNFRIAELVSKKMEEKKE